MMKAVTLRFSQMLHEVGLVLDIGMISALDKDKLLHEKPDAYISGLQDYKKDGHELRHDDALRNLLTGVTGLSEHTINFAKNLSGIGIVLPIEKLHALNKDKPDGYDGKWSPDHQPRPERFGQWREFYSTCMRHYKNDNLAEEYHAPLMAFLQMHTGLSASEVALMKKDAAPAAEVLPEVPLGRPQLTFRPQTPFARRVREAEYMKSGRFNLFCDTPPESPSAEDVSPRPQRGWGEWASSLVPAPVKSWVGMISAQTSAPVVMPDK